MSDDLEAGYTLGSGNVFADLDVPDPDEEYLKAQLARSVRRVIKSRGLTQTQAAHLMGTTQSRVSEVMAGRLGPFSSDRLFRFLRRLNVPVTVTLHESLLADQAAAHMTVVTS